MKSYNIVKKLEKEGYTIIYKKWGYWNNIPHVEFDGFDFAIAEYTSQNNWLGCNLNFIYNHVLEALNVAKNNNPLLLKKIEESPTEDYYYLPYMITSMENYYRYKKNIYPFDDYYKVLEQLKNEVD